MKSILTLLFSMLLMTGTYAKPYDDDKENDTYYYEYSWISTGTGVDSEGYLLGEDTKFKLNNGTVEVYFMLEQDEPLLLSELFYEIYSGDGETYSEQVLNETMKVASKDWNYTYFSVKFSAPGFYVIDMYNQNDVYINSAYFEIEQ